jgi:sec-independent protein translocase protein TatC
VPRLIPRRLAPDEQATLVEHLSELRHRIVIIVIAIVPAFLFTYAIHGWLIGKLKELLHEGTKVVTLGVTEPFTTSVKVSFYAALGLCLPIVIWQIWAFFAPALDRKVQRALSMFVIFASGLFMTGVAFGYFVLLPRALSFLIGYDGDLYEEQVRASYFLSFVTLMLFATGVAFLMPIFILGLVRVGALSSGTLRRNRRIGIVAMTCFAILLPTVDPVSLIFETVPLIALYELSIWLAVLMERRWEPLETDYDLSHHPPIDLDDESGASAFDTAGDDQEEDEDEDEFDDLDGFDDETYEFDESVFDDEPDGEDGVEDEEDDDEDEPSSADDAGPAEDGEEPTP